MSDARVRDARALYAAGRYDGAFYIVGYAVEYRLKGRIATSLLRAGTFPRHAAEFDRLSKIKSHRLDELLRLSGRATKVDGPAVKDAWEYVQMNWTTETRYVPGRVGHGVRGYDPRGPIAFVGAVNDFQNHVRDLYEALRKRNGEFDFFALLEPEESLGKWDLMTSAPWLQNTLEGLAIISEGTRRHLTDWDYRSFGHPVIRPPDYDGNPALSATQPPGVTFPATVANVEIGGAPIRQAVIFKLPPAPAPRRRPTAAKRRPAAARR